MNISWSQLFYRALLPGVFLHELSHLIVVWLFPRVTAVEVDFTSHVKHKGYYTYLSLFMISYAPFVINTTVAFVCVAAISYVPNNESVLTMLGTVALLYGALVSGFTALPSYQDAYSTVGLLISRIRSPQFFSALVMSPFILVVALPGVGVTYICRRFRVVQLGLSAVYAFAILALGFGLVEVPAQPEVYGALFEELRKLI